MLADQLLGDPARYHPVAGFGAWATWLERRCWRDSRAAGAVYWTAAVAPVLAGAVVVERVGRRHPILRMVTTAAATWAVVGARQLAVTGRRMARLVETDLEAARELLPSLCGRSGADLDAAELSRATVESLAENTSDAAVSSLVWGALLGVPGLVLHRAANTLDAMVGHRSQRYVRFGTASARLDDLLGLLPARLTGGLFVVLAPLVGGGAGRAASVLAHDHGAHPSPNGGVCEAAMAGALGVRLGGTNRYPGGRTETRGTLNRSGRPCEASDARRAARLVSAATWLAAVAAGLGAR